MLFDTLLAAVLAVSTFNGLACLWLGVSVALLNWRPAGSAALNEQQSRLLAPLAVGLLALSALFFLAHSAMIGRGIGLRGPGAQFWWQVAWGPVVLVPYLWYGLSVLYSGPAALRRHRLPLVALGLLALAALALTQGGGLPRYEQVLGYETFLLPRLGLPLLLWIELPLLLLCALLPIDALLWGLDEPGQRSAARRRVRPALIATSLLLLLAGMLASLAVGWVWIERLALPPFEVLMLLDLAVSGVIAVATLLVGSTIVSYEVFTGGALPRRGFLQRWVGTVAVLIGSALITAVLNRLDLRPIYGLLAASAVATVAYALLGWQNDRTRAAFMLRLRPFVAAPAPRRSPQQGDAGWQPLFAALCQDVLATERACLLRRTPTGTEIALGYGWPETGPDSGTKGPGFELELPDPRQQGTTASQRGPNLLDGRRYGVAWALPLGSAPTEGLLLFDGRRNGVYSEEEIDLAQACCERLLDALAGEQLTAVAVGLLRQRIAEVKVLGARQRRVLHDEVLPSIHAALIHLAGTPTGDDGLLLTPASASVITEALSDAHRRLADLISAIPPTSPHQLEREGLAAALEAMVTRDFAASFEQICWQAEPRAIEAAATLASFAAEVLFYATQEAVRNAARHGRGGDGSRPLRLEAALRWHDGLHISVEDDGVGTHQAGPTSGGGSGLAFHEAMLTVIGGRLQLGPRPGGGTLVQLILGADKLYHYKW